MTWAVFGYNTLSVNTICADAATVGTVRLTQAVLADGKPLAAATYQVRLTNRRADGRRRASHPVLSAGVEFVKRASRRAEVATVISAADLGVIAEGPQPKANAPRVHMLKGGDYVRDWINKAGTD